MKHIGTVIGAMLALFVVAGCGQSNDAAQVATVEPTNSAPAPEVVEDPVATLAPEAEGENNVSESTSDDTEDLILAPTALPAEEASAENAPAESASTDNNSASSGDYANNEQGVASYLSDVLQGEATASGEIYDKDDYVAAHKDLPFGTEVRVTNLATGKSVLVTIIDRMPSNNPHLIDVSSVAAVELEMIDAGNIDASVEWDE